MSAWREVVLRRGSVEVRAWRDGDADAVATSPGDPVTGRYFGRALSGPPLAVDDPDAPMFAIVRDGSAVGRIWFRPGVRPFEVGYFVRTDMWGRGTATTALSLVAEWMLGEGVEEIVLFTHPGNVGSQKVAERAGFERDGIQHEYADFADGTRAAIRFRRGNP